MCHECEKKNSAYRVFVGESKGKSPLGRPGHRHKDNINGLLEKNMGDVCWIHVAEDRDQWRALANRVEFRKMLRVDEQLLGYQEGPIYIEVIMDVILCCLVWSFTLFRDFDG
jgi:hypothetical protein